MSKTLIELREHCDRQCVRYGNNKESDYYIEHSMVRDLLDSIDCNLEEHDKQIRENAIEEYRRLVTEGIDAGIRCAMCTNHFANEHGCDGGCVVDEYMYKKVMKVIDNHINIDMSIVEQLKGSINE